MIARESPSLVPNQRPLLLAILAFVPVFAFVESLEFQSRNVLEGRHIPWLESFGRLLLPWAMLGLCVPIVLAIVARSPLTGKPRGSAIVVHAATGLLFPFVHFALVAGLKLMGGSYSFGERMRWMFSYVYTTDVIIFCAIAGVCYAVRLVSERHALERESLALRAALSEARLAALQGQLRPHFLFNTLNAVAVLVRLGESEAAVDALARVSDLIRHTIRARERDEVTLDEEFELVRAYLEIECMRFGDRLAVSLELDDSLRELAVPFLLLQPLAENAIRYGVNDRKGHSRVTVRASACQDTARISIEEHGDGELSPDQHQGFGIGLSNTRERLAARYGPAARLELSVDDTGRGSTAMLILPLAAAPATAPAREQLPHRRTVRPAAHHAGS